MTMNRRTSLKYLTWFTPAMLATSALDAAAAPQYAIPASSEAVPRMSLDDFKARVDKTAVVAVDVRSLADYRLGHIPGARSVPLNEVAARIDELRGLGSPIVTYCT